MKKLCLLAGLVLATAYSQNLLAASFDCQKAQSKTEQLICADKKIGAIDERMAATYKDYLKFTPVKQHKSIQDAQVVWLKQRNQCEYDRAAVQCTKNSIAARLGSIEKKLNQAQIDFEENTVKIIPTQPKRAAERLRGYHNELAFAWLVYLNQFSPKSGVTNTEAKKYYLLAKNINNDRFPESILQDMSVDPSVSKDELVLTLLRMQLEQKPLFLSNTDTEKTEHCFIFTRHEQAAYKAFGPLYGSSRDGFSPLCNPNKNDLFKLSEWQELSALIEKPLFEVYSETGTIRSSFSLSWRIDELRANLSPRLYLTDDNKKMPEINVDYPFLWSVNQMKQKRLKVNAATKKWLQKNHHLSATDADKITQAITDKWLNKRLSFIDEWFGLDRLNALYKNKRTIRDLSPEERVQ